MSSVARNIMSRQTTVSLERRSRLDKDVLGEGLEALTVGLDDGDGEVTGLAGIDVPDDAGFAGMGAADDLAGGAVF